MNCWMNLSPKKSYKRHGSENLRYVKPAEKDLQNNFRDAHQLQKKDQKKLQKNFGAGKNCSIFGVDANVQAGA